jgi:hypothetical protein
MVWCVQIEEVFGFIKNWLRRHREWVRAMPVAQYALDVAINAVNDQTKPSKYFYLY